MPSSPLRAVAIAAAAAALACSGAAPSPDQIPHELTISPTQGFLGQAVPVTITGKGLVPRATVPSSGGNPTLDTRHRAWLGDVELTDVTWANGNTLGGEDVNTLTATVPATLPAGSYTLTVQNALGERGTLASAYTSLAGAPFTIAVTAVPGSQTSVNVGQQGLTLAVTVENTGTTDINNFVLGTPTFSTSDGGAAAITGGPTPAAPSTLAAGARATFNYTYRATSAGHVSVSAAATGSTGGRSVSATLASPLSITIQQPAALTAALTVPSSVAIGTSFTVTMAVNDTGGASARDVTPGTLSVVGTQGATPGACTGPTPASATIAGGGSQAFTWSCAAGPTRGTITIGGGASGTDANSGATLTATAPSKSATVAQAAINMTILTQPTSANRGQTGLLVTVRLNNPGTANVTNFAVATPSPAPTNNTPTVIAPPGGTLTNTLAAGATFDLQWNFTAPATGTSLVITFSASGRDGQTNQQLPTSTVQATIALTTPAALTAAWQTPPTAVAVNQTFTAVLRVTNGGGAAVNTVTPTAITGCTGTPAVVASIAAGAFSDLTYTGCSRATAGTFVLSASASGADANSGATVNSNTATANVSVQTAGALTAAWQTPPTAVNVSQTFSATVQVTNSGGTTVNAVSVPAITGCTRPTTSPNINAGASANFTYTSCSSGTAGPFALSATASGTDAITSTTVTSNAATATVQVQTPAGLSATWQVPTAVNVNVAFNAVLRVTNTGTAAANNVAVSAITSCTQPGNQAIAGGATVSFTYSCTPRAIGPFSLSASASGQDANSASTVTSNTAATSVSVQNPAALTASWSAPGNGALVAAPFSATLHVTNTGGATANTVSVSAITGCTGTPAAVGSITGGGSSDFTYTGCSPPAGPFTLSATASGQDANSGLTVTSSAATASITVQ